MPGVLLLNECGGGGGASARVVCPHPNFRLFLALDPRWVDGTLALLLWLLLLQAVYTVEH